MSLSGKKIATLDLTGNQVDIGLLVLRLMFGLILFAKHGWSKLAHFSHGLHTFGDPIGVGGPPSFLVAMTSDSICSLLLVFGLFTRWAGAFAAFNIFVAWATVARFSFLQTPGGEHGELMLLFIAAFVALFFTGGGRYSLDDLLFRR